METTNTKKIKEQEKGYDVFRDSYLRLLGYSNEIGESCRQICPRSLVHLSYGVAMAYVLADTADKAMKEYRKEGSTGKRVAIKAGDVLTWQTFASVILPGYTINRITYFTYYLLKRMSAPAALRFFPCAVGICSIPLIVQPIDRLTDCMMEESYRKYIK